MNKRLLKVQFVTAVFISLMLLSLAPQAVWASQALQHGEDLIPKPFEGYNLDSIYIFYDPADEMMSAVAEGVNEIVTVRINRVTMIPVTSHSDVAYWLLDEPWIAVYALQSTLKGVVFPDREMLWRQFYQTLSCHPSTQHVIGMGNTLSLEPFLHSTDITIHHSEAEVADALILVLYDVWSIMEMCKSRALVNDDYQGAADDLEQMVLQVYADHFSELVQRQFDPIDAVGELDEAAADERYARMLEEHPGSAEDAAYRIAEDGTMEQLPLDNLPDDFSPMIKLSTPAEVAATDFVLSDLPLFSGLRGPIGKIVDVLLKVLETAGKTVISIPESALEDLMDVFETIQPFLGIVSDFDLDSPLKSILQLLEGEFPFAANFKGFIKPIIKALFNLRGGIDGIGDVIGELISGLLPSFLPVDVMDFLDDVLDLGPGLWDLITDVVSGGDGVFDVILSFLTENVLEALLNKTLAATLGISGVDLTNILEKSTSFIQSIVGYLTSFDFTEFIEDVGVDLLNTALGVLTGGAGEAVIGKIMSLIEIAFSSVDLIDEFNMDSLSALVGELLDTFVGSAGMAETIPQAVGYLMDVMKDVAEDAGGITITLMRTRLNDILLTNLTVSVASSTRGLVVDSLALLGGFLNDGFNPADIPNVFDIAEGLVGELGLSTPDFDNAVEALNLGVKPILGIVALVSDSDALKKMTCGTLGDFTSELDSLPDVFALVLRFLDVDDVLEGLPDIESILNSFGQIAGGIMNLIMGVKDMSFEGIMNALLMAVSSIVGIFPSFDAVPIDAMLKLMQSFFPDAFGIGLDDIPNPMEVISEILEMIGGSLTGVFDLSMVEDFLGILFDIQGIFTDGIKWILSKAFDWLTGMITPLLQQLEDMINGAFGGLGDLLGHNGLIPIGIGGWSMFDLSFDLGIRPNFHLNPTPFFEMIRALLFEGKALFSISSLGSFVKAIFTFFEISPQFYAELGVSSFDSSKNNFMEYLLDILGVQLQFSGYAKLVMTLFTFRGGIFHWDDFFHIEEWMLSLKVALEKTFTLADFLTGGVGGGVLSKLASYIGLGGIKVKVWFSLELDIVKKAASAIAPEVSTLTLVVIIGAALSMSINIIIASASFYGSLEIIFSFFLDFAGSTPMKILLRLVLTLKLKIRFLFATWKKTWTWEPGGPWDLSPSKGSAEYDASGMGFDTDGDGLSDDYERTIPGLRLDKPDTDDDGASDKLEVMVMGTDATDPDSDDDGLLDGEEWDLGTNPLRPDTDWDRVGDYEEARVYGTDPLSQDSDGDGLTDYQEIFTALNMTGVWVPVGTEIIVTIGGVDYTDHTNPLVQDTDGDGIVDGDEGPSGAYYGLASLYNDTYDDDAGEWEMDPNPLIFNMGFTHPLDPDTDDDSWLQLYNGAVDTQAFMLLKDMNDGAEIAGFWIVLYDDEGEPEDTQVFTNPCNPDTDGDTGITDRTPLPGAWINSDGYELAQTPPTDPTDGDTDNDGLLDGIEGVLNPRSNHTDPLDPDTDDDGLFDMQEILLGTDPRCQDTDLDMISDGDEFYIFFTSPYLFDTDFDGLSDGEEVYFWHSNPLIDDSDGDGLSDGQEVLVYGSDPMDEDSDNDGLTDFEEIFIYYTDPFTYDSDADGLSDGSEILFYGTDPLNWDTDYDSITEPNADGEFTWPMSDYDEIFIYGTNATDPDTDLDGLSDAFELYLGSGEIPWMDPIPLNPLSNDTDNDLLMDGSELILKNVTDIVYPYVALTIVLRYNTSPVLRDTDNDTLIDYQEVMVFNTNPASNDTDGDGLPDWWETWVYNTSAIFADTDGDNLTDYEETLYEVWPYGPWPPSNWSIGMSTEDEPEETAPFFTVSIAELSISYPLAQEHEPIYPTSATDPDSDNDWLPDGAEVQFYGSNPMSDDTDGDGIPDTLEYDTDYDMLPDGIEFKIGLQLVLGGGILNPDSDHDGLLDGEEYYIYGTDPALADTDGDGYSDGLEIMLGLDPLTFTTEEEFQMALATERGKGTMRIIAPLAEQYVYQDSAVGVVNYTMFQEMWFRFKNDTSDEWSAANYTLEYNPATQLWYNDDVFWSPGNYTLQVFGKNGTGVIHALSIWFVVQPGLTPFPWLLIGLSVAAVAGVVIVGFVGHKKGWWASLSGKVKTKLGRPGTSKKKPAKKGTTVTSKKTPKKKATKKASPSKGKKGGA